MHALNYSKVFFDALLQVEQRITNVEVAMKLTLKLIEALTLLASESKKELVNVLFRSGLMPYRKLAVTDNKRYLEQLCRLLIHGDAGI